MLKPNEENASEFQSGTSVVLIHTIDRLTNLHVRLRIYAQKQEGEVRKSAFNDHILINL
jgi:hypothetical protein